MRTPLFGIAREGYPLIIPPLLFGVILLLLGFTATPIFLILVGLFCIYFFRDPERPGSFAPHQLVSPADGKVIGIKRHSEGPESGVDVVQICIFLNIFDVHINRSPVTGTIADLVYRRGRFHAADKDVAGLENEHTLVTVDVEGGPRIYFKQIAGLVARRVVFWGNKGDRVEAGMRIGLMKFSSRMDIFVPADRVDIQIQEGQRVKAGVTVLGELRA
ncbi:phosphatidylserine decarboxylase [Desulfurispira natronophila]|uniref:Phosphatidylserine decarboxylase proenzyme n=1 Tax=Desulfurispira natronophila TaxID=682562 RepID=A0A7W7Y335_9BACT|nr:phosphatidylserine decarboxylase [Desulfurispira natronophila]MBB5021205.1 phosphatidylserine decarboxylase [Desulfurispira natronophila]